MNNIKKQFAQKLMDIKAIKLQPLHGLQVGSHLSILTIARL